MEKDRKRIGQNARGRVVLGLRENRNCLSLALYGMSYKTIADKTGLSTGQVGYRLQLMGYRTRDYRNGIGKGAEVVFRKFHIVNGK